MLSASPAAKLLARIQRQIAAHERAWFRAHRELVRSGNWGGDPQPDACESAAVPAEAQSSEPLERTQSPAPKSVKAWPPVDEKTGKPLFFVG
jgi:hypothetical protein